MLDHDEAVRQTRANIDRFKTEKGRPPNPFELAFLIPTDATDSSTMSILVNGMEALQ